MAKLINLNNKKILLGVSGSIAVGKALGLVDAFRAAGAEVKLVCTASSKHFFSANDLEIFGDIFSEGKAQMDHITLAKWADVLLIAPASAGIISRCAMAMASDLLSLVYLATAARVIFAPAMNQQMWQQDVVKKNVDILKNSGCDFFGPDHGQQACGDVGFGRMVEPKAILNALNDSFQEDANGLNVLITAGPTREPIDPVRFISNRSSGKMGYALARAFTHAGAKVTLVSGPTNLPRPYIEKFIGVETAKEMMNAVFANLESQNVFVANAAVGDFRCKNAVSNKIKKDDTHLTLELTKNPDILKTLSNSKPNIYTVGFALETENLLESATEKLQQKNLDMVIANQFCEDNQVFNSEFNQVYVVDSSQQIRLPKLKKQVLAQKLVKMICQRINKSL